MARLLMGIVMILFIGGQTTSQEFTISFELIQEIIEWSMRIYEIRDEQTNSHKSRENIETTMKQVADVSSKLNALESHLDVKLDTILDTSLVDTELENSLNQLKASLRHSFDKIDNYFDRSRKYKLGGAFYNSTLINFSHKVLSSARSVPHFLDDMHQVFIPVDTKKPGFLALMLQYAMRNLLHDCDTDVSAQQKVYYIYIQLIITEIKGLMTQRQSLMIQRWFDVIANNYTNKLNIAKSNFQTRLSEYHALFTREITQFPRQLRRCEGNPPIRGINFLELEKFSRIAILDADIIINHGCMACPVESTLNALSLQTNTTINDCKYMGKTVEACPAEPGSPHEYLWLRDEGRKHYGPNTPCANTKIIGGGYARIPGPKDRSLTLTTCSVCACSVETNNVKTHDTSTIGRISVTEQMSDIWDNKVVTGVRFVTQDNALHLQIQQAQFSHNGMIHNNSEWKQLDIGNHDAGIKQVKKSMQYEPLRHDRKSLYLDDIEVPEGYVVTGVRFKLADDTAFKLEISATQFEFGTGNMDPSASSWIDALINPMRRGINDDYKRQRVEINMGESNDPTRASQFKYDLESNKLIKFTHTDINKDAGQTTIPLIDSQSVESQPSFPLSGMGIFFKGRDGFGGYIAPRIYTLNVKKYMTFPDFSRYQSTTTRIPSTIDEVPLYKGFRPENPRSANDACCE